MMGPTAIRWHVTPSTFVVPDVEQSFEDHCQLTGGLLCRKFSDLDVNKFLIGLFHAIHECSSAGLLQQVQLSRFDLFHGHIFRDHWYGDLGILFHAAEYPVFDRATFPYLLGYCQKGSSLNATNTLLDFRNILWYQDCVYVLDVSPNSPLYLGLLHGGTRELRTVYEEDFGRRVIDVFYFAKLHGRRPYDKLFCG